MTPEQAKIRGRLATLLFCAFGVVGWVMAPGAEPAPLIMYALLMVQTWFSLPLFFRLIDPKLASQRFVDVSIGFAYAFLGYAVRDSVLFVFAWTVFFALTVLKYALLVGRFSEPVLLRRKLTANALGVGLGLLMSLHVQGAWVGVALFGGACAYYLAFKPLYVTDKV